MEPIVADIEPRLAVDDIEKLLRIHFVLTETDERGPGIIDFVEALPDRVRRIKTAITQDVETRRGEIRGHIDWQRTIKQRYRSPYPDSTRYTCRESSKNFEIDENLVLASLLSVVHEIVFDDLQPVLDDASDYRWLDVWLNSEQNLLGVLNRVFRENVYLQRIETDGVRVTDRMIRSVKRSRSPLYREAALLLDRYRRLLRYELDPKEAKELLKTTFIRPEREDLLFELYWIFRVLSTYDSIRFKLVDGTSDVVAHWETDESRYVLYHDSTGSAYTRFHEDLRTVDEPRKDGYLYRMTEVIERWQKLGHRLLDIDGSDTLWGGRPDILIEKYPRDQSMPDEVFIGEVKYTRSRSYAAQGLRELLEYMALVKSSDEYVEAKSEVLTSTRVHGLLFVDRIDSRGTSEKSSISIKQFGDTIDQPI